MMTSPLFRNLGLASGLDGLDGDPPVKGASKFVPGNTMLPSIALEDTPDMPLYKPKDSFVPIKISDTRKVNPATGQPFKKGAPMSANVNPRVASMIIDQAMKKGIDPNTALAIALQETHMGNKNENVGSAWSYLPDEGIEDPYEQGANSMMKAITEKMAYAKQLGYDKKGEAYALQAYNGYGKLIPRNTAPGAVESFYEIPTTRANPLNMAHNPVYGKNIISVRDEIIRRNPELQALVQKAMTKRKAPPMQAPVTAYVNK